MTPLEPQSKWLKDLAYLLRSKNGLISTVFLVVAFSALGFLIYRFFDLISPQNIEISTSHGSITLVRGNKKETIFLLNPNGDGNDSPWVRTGIQLKKGNEIKITASGRVNTAMKRVVAQTVRPEIEKQIWVDPRGQQQLSDDESKRLRNLDKYKLYSISELSQNKEDENLCEADEETNKKTNDGFGLLLAAVMDSSEVVEMESIKPFPQDPRNETLSFTAEQNGELVLTVNDIWLSPEAKNGYIAPWKYNIEYYLQTAKFDAALRDENLTPFNDALLYIENLTKLEVETLQENLTKLEVETLQENLTKLEVETLQENLTKLEVETLQENLTKSDSTDKKTISQELSDALMGAESELEKDLSECRMLPQEKKDEREAQNVEGEESIEIQNLKALAKALVKPETKALIFTKSARFNKSESLLSKEEKETLVEPLTKAYNQYLKRARDWKSIEEEKYWSIWYEDNIGSFSVSITVNP